MASKSKSLAALLFYALMCAGLWLMFEASWSYWTLGDEHPFLLEKMPLARPALYATALYVHVQSALLSLPACLVLLVPALRTRWPRVHRYLGRVTFVVLVLGVIPSGMYLALFAQGGWLTTFGFWLTGAIAGVAMVKSVRSARARNMAAHRRFAVHVTAQLAVAVVSRFFLIGAETLGLYGKWTYAASLWLPVLLCAALAELVTGAGIFSPSKGSRHEQMAVVSRSHAVR